MKIDLRQKKHIYFQTKYLGKLYIFDISIKDQNNIIKDLGTSIEKSSPIKLIKTLIKNVCHPENLLEDGQYKPDKPSLDEQMIEKLNDDELENFAVNFIKNNEYLFRESIKKEEKDNDGNTILDYKMGKIIYPKKPDENNIKYLHRLLTIEEKEWIDPFEKLAKSFTEHSNFSKNVQNMIKNTMSIGDSLKSSMSSLHEIQPIFIKPAEDVYNKIDLAEIERMNEEARIQPFRELLVRLDKIIETSKKTTDFIIAMNSTQVNIADELKKSGDEAAHFSKINKVLTIIVIALTTLSLLIGYNSIRASDDVIKKQNELMNKGIETISVKLQSINDNLELLNKNTIAPIPKNK